MLRSAFDLLRIGDRAYFGFTQAVANLDPEIQVPAFGDVSLHRTVQVDGMTRMREVESLTLQPGERAELQPGGLHLMMPAPETRLSAGDRVPLVLLFADGNQIEVQAEVRKKP